MKIGILSLVLHQNYGGILQSYALQTVLEGMGHEVEVLTRAPEYPSTNWKEMPKRFLKKLLGRDEVLFKELRYRKEAPIINKGIWDFRKKYIHERIINNLLEIKESDYDCIVVGSDQVWRPRYIKEQWQCCMENAFLSFTKGWNINRISYSASLGVDEWEYTAVETELCRDAIKAFNAVSVREESGIELLKYNLHTDSEWVLDPTMLLNKDDYCKLVNKSHTPKSKGNLLVYILNGSKEKTDLVKRVSLERELTVFNANRNGVRSTASIKDRTLPSIEQWIRGFMDADFIITDSFHACVFSILFDKPFVAIGNKTRGMSRFDILNKLGLEKNLLLSVDDYEFAFDYKLEPKIAERLDILRDKSLTFLKQNLCNG